MRGSLIVLLLLSALASQAVAAPRCDPPMSEDKIRAIIDAERAKRADLPAAFPKATWKIHRDRCHYKAIEWPDPAPVDSAHLFTLNSKGVIVDVTIGNSLSSPMQCPSKVFNQAALARVVANARKADPELPGRFKRSRVRVDRMNCGYMYFEYRIPEKRGDFQTFLIDSLGELMTVQRSQPY